MQDDFISRYLIAQSGTMVPRRYTMWCGLFLLGAAVGKSVYVDHKHFIIRCNNYFGLVGKAGTKKTTAMRSAKTMFRKAFPNALIGAAVMSREKIVEVMSQDSSQRLFPDSYPFKTEEGTTRIYTPCTFFINEFKNFVSIEINRMIEFLTDIYDEETVFDSATIKHGFQPVIEPCVNILACMVPKWVIEKLRADILVGGIARRLILVHETERPPRILKPIKSAAAVEAEAWCIEHLRKVAGMAGEFTWEAAGEAFLEQWFIDLPEQENEVLESFYEAKDILVTKIAMLLAMAQPEPKLVLTEVVLRMAVAFLESIEDNLPLLTVGAGRNELAIPTQRLMQLLKDNDGLMKEYIWHKIAGTDMTEGEYAQCKLFLRSTRQLIEDVINGETYVMTRDAFLKRKAEAEAQAKNDNENKQK